MKIEVKQGEIPVTWIDVMLETEAVLVLEIDSSAKYYESLLATGPDGCEVWLQKTGETIQLDREAKGGTTISIESIGEWDYSTCTSRRYTTRVVFVRERSRRRVWPEEGR